MIIREKDLYKSNELYHFGVKGMKWGVRKARNNSSSYNRRFSDEDIIIKKGTKIHRNSTIENESHSGHAYASYKEKDVKKYADIMTAFHDVYDMEYTSLEKIVSPSKQKRVDTFIEMNDESYENRKQIAKAKADIMKYIPGVVKHYEKKYYNLKNANPKVQDSAYQAFAYALAYDKKLRNEYFSRLKRKGYNAVLDDADIGRGFQTESPIIIFDREKSLSKPKVTKLKYHKEQDLAKYLEERWKY